MNVYLKIFRFNPDVDTKPYYKIYTLCWKKGLTLLNAIKYIYETIDPTLGFKNYCCRRGLCASCLMTVDHVVKKSCHVVLMSNHEYLVEPLRGHSVIRDLVVENEDY